LIDKMPSMNFVNVMKAAGPAWVGRSAMRDPRRKPQHAGSTGRDERQASKILYLLIK
jgi:hypothetical protein